MKSLRTVGSRAVDRDEAAQAITESVIQLFFSAENQVTLAGLLTRMAAAQAAYDETLLDQPGARAATRRMAAQRTRGFRGQGGPHGHTPERGGWREPLAAHREEIRRLKEEVARVSAEVKQQARRPVDEVKATKNDVKAEMKAAKADIKAAKNDVKASARRSARPR